MVFFIFAKRSFEKQVSCVFIFWLSNTVTMMLRKIGFIFALTLLGVMPVTHYLFLRKVKKSNNIYFYLYL